MRVVQSTHVFHSLSTSPNGDPATLEISPEGTITAIHQRILSRDELPSVQDHDWLDFRDAWILPGVGHSSFLWGAGIELTDREDSW